MQKTTPLMEIQHSLILKSHYFSEFQPKNQQDEWFFTSKFQRNFSPKYALYSSLDFTRLNNSRLDLHYQKIKPQAGIRLRFLPPFQITGKVGITNLKKYSRNDNAFSYGVSSLLQLIQTESRLMVGSDWDREQFSEYSNRFSSIQASYQTQLSGSSSDSLVVVYSERKMADYFNPELELERVNIRLRQAENDLRLYSGPKWSVRNITLFRDRDFRQSRPLSKNERSELELSNEFRIQKNGPLWQLGLSVKNYYLYNDFREDYLDNEHIFFIAQSNISRTFRQKHSLKTTLYFSKLEYNTPDEELNFDDRDEMRLSAVILYLHNNQNNYQYGIGLEGNFYQTRYISARKSAINNREFILSLTPSYKMDRNRFTNFFRTRISSYYLVYDYAGLLPQIQSFVNRKLLLEDSLRYTFPSGNRIETYVRYELEEIGLLDWKAFQSAIERMNRQNQWLFMYTHFLYPELSLTSGFSFIFRKDFYIPGTRRVLRDYNNKSFWWKMTYTGLKSNAIVLYLNHFLTKEKDRRQSAELIGKLEVTWHF